MDYSKLLHVTDSLSGNKQESVSAPSVHSTIKKHPLDSIEVVTKIQDSAPYKVVIIDDAQVLKIMGSPREQRRKLLSRLTDSQRRRVLTRYRELTRVNDDDSNIKLDLFTLDSAINNYLFDPDDYNKGIFDEASVNIPAEIKEFVAAVAAQDRQKVVNLLPSYKKYLDTQGIYSDIQLAEELQSSVTDSLNPDQTRQVQEKAEEDCKSFLDGTITDPFEAQDNTIASFVQSGAGDYDSVEELYVDAWNACYGRHTANTADSYKAQLDARKVMDDVIDQLADLPLKDEDGKDIVPDEDRSILEVLSEALTNYLDGDDKLLQKIATTSLDGDVINPEDSEESTEEETEAPDESEEGQVDAEPTDVADEDGDKDTENEEVTDSFNAEGLQHEAADINETMENIQVTNEKEDEEYAKNNKKLLKEIENQSHVTAPHNSDVFDCVQLAKNVLNKVTDNALVLKLTPKVPALQKYNFIQDCDMPFYTINEPQAGVANPPLTREEYYTIAPQVPEYFPIVVASYPCPECPPVHEFTTNENCVTVSPNGCTQTYYPYNCTMQEITDLLGCADSANYASVINEHCIPVSHAFHLAALTNNLSIIDSRFYKKHMSDSAWCWDEVPACLSDYVKGPGSIQAVRDAENAITLYGVKFVIK